jgi:hypothetical protein
LAAWAEGFYAGHTDVCVRALLPTVRVHLAWLHASDDPETVTEALVRADLDLARTQLSSVLAEDPVDFQAALSRLMQRWERDRAAHLADTLMARELTYAG